MILSAAFWDSNRPWSFVIYVSELSLLNINIHQPQVPSIFLECLWLQWSPSCSSYVCKCNLIKVFVKRSIKILHVILWKSDCSSSSYCRVVQCKRGECGGSKPVICTGGVQNHNDPSTQYPVLTIGVARGPLPVCVEGSVSSVCMDLMVPQCCLYLTTEISPGLYCVVFDPGQLCCCDTLNLAECKHNQGSGSCLSVYLQSSTRGLISNFLSLALCVYFLFVSDVGHKTFVCVSVSRATVTEPPVVTEKQKPLFALHCKSTLHYYCAVMCQQDFTVRVQVKMILTDFTTGFYYNLQDYLQIN